MAKKEEKKSFTIELTKTVYLYHETTTIEHYYDRSYFGHNIDEGGGNGIGVNKKTSKMKTTAAKLITRSFVTRCITQL